MSQETDKTTMTSEETAELLDEGAACRFDGVSEPCIILIFGATGDLTSRKLFPALFTLFVNGRLPEPCLIVGASRTKLSTAAFRDHLRQSLEGERRDLARFKELAARIFYQSVDFEDTETFKELAKVLKTLDAEHKTGGNLLIYLAVPPTAYEAIAARLGAAGLSREGRGWLGWVRMVVEKPFGHDLPSARSLDATLHNSFEEHQIFRIDHYLAKETVQNVIMLRFANSIFEPVWNRQYIRSVFISAAESVGVGHRAGYYDQAGVLRDMFQNHMMQLLSLSAMEPPSLFEGDRVRDEKTKVYRALKPFPRDKADFNRNLVLGQYAAGTVDGEKVADYIDEPGVAPDSLTPTYASMKVYIDNWRWQGVPFVLTSGKRLAEKRTEIAVQFKEVPHSMFRHVLGGPIAANRLVLSIQPSEEVNLAIQAKVPGPKACLRTVTMRFDYGQGAGAPPLDAYEKVLLDCMLGDHTLFWREDSVELCWGFLTPILEECDCPDRADQLYLYKAGTHGPQQAKKLLENT